MRIQPEIIHERAKPGCKVSVILLDWHVRESYHSIHYLNHQTVPRDQYELIWLEFYRHKPARLFDLAWRHGRDESFLDKWFVAGYPAEYIFNKHRLYNLGILVAEGDICVICDSDAIFSPTFIEKVIEAFADGGDRVVHFDEIRNVDRGFYPFRYPPLRDLLTEDATNWNGQVTHGLDNSQDMLHDANYGACMAARRRDLIAIGGADEHLDYLGYVCGPYELTFRLVNQGYEEIWQRDEYLYHTWHPNQTGINTDYQGPHDGRGMSLRSLHARNLGRVQPFVENPWIAQARQGETFTTRECLDLLRAEPEPTWCEDSQPPSEDVYWMERDFMGFNIFGHKGYWLALKSEEGIYDPSRRRSYKPFIQRRDVREVRHLIEFYNQLPAGFWDRIKTQPFTKLPGRAWQWMGRELARWR